MFACAGAVRILLVLIAAIVLAILVIGGGSILGPIMSGAILLPFYAASESVRHDLPSSYQQLHKGHVDGGTGVYYRIDEDLVLHETPTFVLRRAYRSGDLAVRHFGVGATHNGEWYLRGGDPEDLQWAELIQEDSMRQRFARRSMGRGVSNALFEHTSGSSEYFGARLGWLGFYWAMALEDGTAMIFKPCGPSSGDACSIMRLRDADNHWTHFRRDKAGILREVAAGNATIAFEYDRANRVTRARASTGPSVDYHYDSRGRLSRVATSEGVIRSYTYTPAGEMLTIDEPGWFIRNTYENGRVVRQDTDMPASDGTLTRYTFTWTYRLRGDRVWITEVSRPDGTIGRYEFDEHGYQISDTDEPAPARKPS